MNLFFYKKNSQMNFIPKELFGLRIEVIRSNRKTTALHIIGDKLQVRVPNRLRDGKIIEILETKERWIRNKAIQLKSQTIIKEREYITGESFSLFGRNLKLEVLIGKKGGTKLIDNYLMTTVPYSEIGALRKLRIKNYIEKWYVQEAYKRLEEKVIKYSEIIRVCPREIKVRNYKTRWGSCDKEGRLTFNFHLIKAPHSIVDYVVIHELCHIIQPNHSKFFWNEVAKYDSLFKVNKKWLKENGHLLIN
tara:strand:- start:1195 stop:1938 length:744 start_codon:yes stop_codon:yes gene_type:complete